MTACCRLAKYGHAPHRDLLPTAPVVTKPPAKAAPTSKRGRSTGPRTSAAETVTDRLISLIESSGYLPWEKPWPSGGRPRNLVSKRPYRGVNLAMLTMAGAAYTSPFWLTYAQASQLKGRIKAGSKATPAIFWKFPTAEERALARRVKAAAPDADEAQAKRVDDPKAHPFARTFWLFHVTQTEGLQVPDAPDAQLPTPARINSIEAPSFSVFERLDAVIAAMPDAPKIVEGGFQAAYRPSVDTIYIEARAKFRSPESFASTLLHELAHATSAKHRLHREIAEGFSHFGDERYSREELCAELTSAWILAELGIATEREEEQAAGYLQSWLSRLKGDRQLLLVASGQASRAADYIMGRVADEPASTEDTPDAETPLAQAA